MFKVPLFLLSTFLIYCNAQNKKPLSPSSLGVQMAYQVDSLKPLNNSMMNEAQFWSIIDKLKDSSLRDMFHAMSSDEILQFDLRFDSLMSMAYHYKLWGAAYVINGGCSDDCFQDFRTNLITHGKEKFYATLKDPESCRDWIKSESLLDERPYITVYEVYMERTGHEPPQQQVIKYELKGKPFNEATVYRQYPKLAKRFLGY